MRHALMKTTASRLSSFSSSFSSSASLPLSLCELHRSAGSRSGCCRQDRRAERGVDGRGVLHRHAGLLQVHDHSVAWHQHGPDVRDGYSGHRPGLVERYRRTRTRSRRSRTRTTSSTSTRARAVRSPAPAVRPAASQPARPTRAGNPLCGGWRPVRTGRQPPQRRFRTAPVFHPDANAFVLLRTNDDRGSRSSSSSSSSSSSGFSPRSPCRTSCRRATAHATSAPNPTHGMP